MTIENTITEIIEILNLNGESLDATAYGINYNNGEIDIKDIAQHPDVYMLIDQLNDDKRLANNSFDYFCLLTTGWAAPLNEDGEVRGAPSKHPERKRVSLLITADLNNNNDIISAIKFHDDEADLVFDYGQATGSLAEAINSLFN